MRKVFAVAILIGIIILLAYYFSRPKPLRPIIVTWQEVGEVWGFVDLDADGNDELLVLVWDESEQWWWVQFRPTFPIRQKIPVPKGSSLWSGHRGQMLVSVHPKTRQAFLVTRQDRKWATKDLGILRRDDEVVIKDADHDGQVNDVVVWRGQTRTVFSRLKDGTIVERPDLPDWRADLDGDGKDDAVYCVSETEVHIYCSSGRKASLELFPKTYITVVDMDGDKVAEIVSAEWLKEVGWRFHCWRYENRRWLKSSSPKFGGMWYVASSDAFLSFAKAEEEMSLFRDEKGVYLLAVTLKGQHAKIWEVRWRGGKWTKRLIGEVPERNAYKILLARTGRDWIVCGEVSPPNWQKWLWEKVGRPLQRFFPFLHEPKKRVFVYGWDGKRRWVLLSRWWIKNLKGFDFQLADINGDRKRELSIALQRRVLIVKFEDGRWRTGWVELPFEPQLIQVILFTYGFRYGGREWAIFQERDGNRCVAIALEGDGQQSKRHQPQRRN